MRRLLCGLIACVVWWPSPARATHPAGCNGGPFGLPGLQGPADQIGEWGPVEVWPEMATHSTLLHTGKVLWWRGTGTSQSPVATYLWNPTTRANSLVPSSATDLFCAGHTTLADGRVIAIGGTATYGPIRAHGETHVFDPETEVWNRVADMNYPRWYPTATTLDNGRVLAVAGWIGPPPGDDAGEPSFATIPEVYDVATNTWTELPGVDLNLPTYSFDFVLPNGLVFIAGPSRRARTLDVQAQVLAVVATSYGSDFSSSAAMYRPGLVLKSGGVDSNVPDLAQDLAQVIDMTAPTPAWRDVGTMVWPRRRHNMVLLPDGNALIVGGSIIGEELGECAVHSAELWDPVTEVFTEMASMVTSRIYHSSALLLPDGRVLSAGGEGLLPRESAEIYSPPYLFRGPRPVIGAAPGATDYGQSFRVETPNGALIGSVAFLRPGSATHNFDESQRYLPLAFTAGASHLDVEAPETPFVAPPGYYMLFLVDQNGVPSMAEFVLLGASPGVPVPALSGAGVALCAMVLSAAALWAVSRRPSR